MVDAATRDLATAVANELESRGLASGAWLVEIEQVRRSLRDADTLLLRIHDAIIRDADRSLEPMP